MKKTDRKRLLWQEQNELANMKMGQFPDCGAIGSRRNADGNEQDFIL